MDGTPTGTKHNTQKENLFYQYHNSHTGLIAIFLHREECSEVAKSLLAWSQWETFQKLWEYNKPFVFNLNVQGQK